MLCHTMTEDEESTLDEYRGRLNEATSEGSGCTETWEILTNARRRRQFIKQAGLTVGAATLGTGVMSGTTVAEPPIDSERLTGKRRDRVIANARQSKQTRLVSETLNGVPPVEAAVEYKVGNNQGVSVQFGTAENTSKPVIHYYQEDNFSTDHSHETIGSENVKVLGSKQIDNGLRVVDGQLGSQFDVGDTPLVQETRDKLEAQNKRFRQLKENLQNRPEKFELHTDKAYLLREVPATDKFIYRVALSKDGEFQQYLQAVGIDPATADVSLTQAEGSNHVHCSFGICIDYCGALCSVLAGLTGAACVAACVAYVATVPVAPTCGIICFGLANNACYSTCFNEVH